MILFFHFNSLSKELLMGGGEGGEFIKDESRWGLNFLIMTLCIWSLFCTIIPSLHGGAVGQLSPGPNSPSGGSFRKVKDTEIQFPHAVLFCLFFFHLIFNLEIGRKHNACKRHQIAVSNQWHIHCAWIQGLKEDAREHKLRQPSD